MGYYNVPSAAFSQWVAGSLCRPSSGREGGKEKEGRRGGGELELYVDFLHGLLLTGTSPHCEVERLA